MKKFKCNFCNEIVDKKEMMSHIAGHLEKSSKEQITNAITKNDKYTISSKEVKS